MAQKSKNVVLEYSAWTRRSLFAGVVGLITGLANTAFAQDVRISPLSGFGNTMAEHGIVFNSSYTGEFADVLSGGERQGSNYAYMIIGGADADLGKLAGIDGGSLHIEFKERSGYSVARNEINNSTGLQGIYGGGQTYHLVILTYEQKLFRNTVDLTVGRYPLAADLIADPIYYAFQSSSIYVSPIWSAFVSNEPSPQVTNWAGRAVIETTRDTHILLGIYDNNPVAALPAHHGFDLSFGGSNGAQGLVEFDYQTSFADDRYPRRFDIGALIDRTPYTYSSYTVGSHSLGSVKGYGRSIIYFQAKQMVYRPDMTSHRGLTLFGVAAITPSNTQTSSLFMGAGAFYLGPFASRPNDTIGLLVDDTHYRNSYLNTLYNYRVNVLGGSEKPSADMIMGELNYNMVATSWLNVMPNFQYVVHPDGLGGLYPYPRRNISSAFVFGLEFNVNIANFVGLPSA
ncbi:carbohydrate porin [Acidocella facilis]|uniref:carbohydrate porin n=1 Tax=Acidocella facilis TaxID=525 RepID=UPI001F2A446F|nr:carbohydrate porin [Acidocella facilis]